MEEKGETGAATAGLRAGKKGRGRGRGFGFLCLSVDVAERGSKEGGRGSRREKGDESARRGPAVRGRRGAAHLAVAREKERRAQPR